MKQAHDARGTKASHSGVRVQQSRAQGAPRDAGCARARHGALLRRYDTWKLSVGTVGSRIPCAMKCSCSSRGNHSMLRSSCTETNTRAGASRDSTRHRTVSTSFRWPDFAFLAARHTAELTHERIAKVVLHLHLAASMQFCGFRSVIGMKWAIADTDRRDLAGNSYDSVFLRQAARGSLLSEN